MVRTLFAGAFEPFTKRGLEHRFTRSSITSIDLPGNTLLNWLDRSFQFYEDSALCRDVRRKLELCLDPAVLHTVWDSTWNQWKHLAGVAIEVNATLVQRGKYRKRRGDSQYGQTRHMRTTTYTVWLDETERSLVSPKIARETKFVPGQKSACGKSAVVSRRIHPSELGNWPVGGRRLSGGRLAHNPRADGVG